ncbi:MAG: hypothetical protein ACREMC_02945 [Gemmatimonadales bacterium]
MSSASSPVNEALAGYIAGRVKAERVVAVVAEAYYSRDTGSGMRDTLRPVIEVVERAHPGVVELTGTPARPGFAVRLGERPFPKEYEALLRDAVGVVVGTLPASRIPHPGILARIAAAIRRVFTAST